MKIGVIASTDVCLPLLYHLASTKQQVCLFYAASSQPDVMYQVTSLCNNYRIPIVQSTSAEQVYEWADSYHPDIVFVTGYGQLIDENRFGSPKYGTFNIHFGALPNYRGPSPVFWQLKNGEKTIDVCIHKITRKADAGPVVWRKSINNEQHYSYTYINQYLSNVLIEGVNFILTCLFNGGKLSEFAQDETVAKYYSRPSLKDVMINWSTMKGEDIINLCMACNNWNWGAITTYKGAELKILDATINTGQIVTTPGTVLCINNEFTVACLDGSLSIHFMSMNGAFFAGRYAGKYGLMVDYLLGS
ncbi:MAG: hypothetical protein ICV66_11020 [Chitinophagaceae bacterium]|nr:hypothetical protein [Chitinophagaceae bacterium]